jgi:hypothetical protein
MRHGPIRERALRSAARRGASTRSHRVDAHGDLLRLFVDQSREQLRAATRAFMDGMGALKAHARMDASAHSTPGGACPRVRECVRAPAPID